MLGGFETLIGLAILLFAIAFAGPKVVTWIIKARTYHRVASRIAEKKVKELMEKIEKGEITADEAMKELEKELEG